MNYLSSRVMGDGRGDRHGVVSRDLTTGASLLAFCWVDRERRYFISACSSLSAGPLCVRKRWRQVDPTPDADPELVEVIVPQPAATHTYYSACGKIDQHNRLRQSALMLETKLKTIQWWRRVNNSVFGMCVVDAYLIAVGCQGTDRWNATSDFVMALIDDLIDNKYQKRVLRKRDARRASLDDSLFESESGTLEAIKQTISATPTKRSKKSNPKHRAQGKCMSCKMLTSHVCRLCQHHQQDPRYKQFWICQKAGMACMGDHILKEHPDKAVYEVKEEIKTAVI